MKVNTHPIHPAMVEGAGGNGGGENWETEVGLEARGINEVEVEEAIRLRARDGARPAICRTRFGKLRFVSKQV